MKVMELVKHLHGRENLVYEIYYYGINNRIKDANYDTLLKIFNNKPESLYLGEIDYFYFTVDNFISKLWICLKPQYETI